MGKEMNSEEPASEEVVEESKEESDSGMASLALASAFVAKSIFNNEDNGYVSDTKANDVDFAPTYCFMARGSKVTSRAAYFETFSEDDSDYESKPSYKKLAKIATEQQSAIENIQKLLDKSDDLLDEEMDRSQTCFKNSHVLSQSMMNLKVVMWPSQLHMRSCPMNLFKGSKNSKG
jgi:hypothetical protein